MHVKLESSSLNRTLTYRGDNSNKQVHHLLCIFLVVAGCIPWKRDSGIRESNKEQEHRGAEQDRQQLGNSICAVGFPQLHVVCCVNMTQTQKVSINLKHTLQMVQGCQLEIQV